MAELQRTAIDEEEAKRALALLDPAWEVLEPRERERLMRLVVERVEYDGAKAGIEVTFHPLGIATLATEARGISQKGDPARAQERQVVQGVA